jgi:hypothetical protein
MNLKKLFADMKQCKKCRPEYRVKPTIKFYIDTDHYAFAFLPTVLWEPWVYRYPGLDGVVDIWWFNMHILIGTWEVLK